MNLEVLVATMHQNDYSLLEQMNIQSDAVVINQNNLSSIDNIKKDNFNIKWLNSKERGLSRSRNMAIKNATADICVLADDDLEYIPNYKNIIIEQFKLNPSTDIIAFQVEGIENKFKDYYSKPRKLNYLTSMKVSSVEIAFRLKAIRDAGIKFNELFGSGAKYFACEENIFLVDCLKRGLKIKYIPIKIADLHMGESTWFRGYNQDYFITKGAGFTAMSKLFSVPLIMQFAFRKYKLFYNEMTRCEAIRLMLEGRKKFMNEED